MLIIYAAIVIIIVVITFLQPYFGLLLICFNLPFEGLGKTGYSTLLSIYGGIVCLASSYLVINRLKKVTYNNSTIFYIIFLLWSLISWFWSEDVGANLSKNITYFSLLLYYFLIILLPNKSDDTMHLKAFVIGILLSTSIMILFLPEMLYFNDPDRASGGGLDPNDFASLIAIALPLAIMWLQLEETIWKKFIPALFIPIGLLGISYTGSRTGTVALLPFGFFALSLVFNKKKSVMSLAAIVLVGVGLTLILKKAPESYFARVRQSGIESSDEIGGRLPVWTTGLNMFLNNPLSGVGTGNFMNSFHRYTKTFGRDAVAHNSFISVAGELGIIGLLLFAYIIVAHLKILYNFIKQPLNDQRSTIISKGLLFALLAYIIASMGISLEYKKVLPLLIGSTILLTRKEIRRPGQRSVDHPARSAYLGRLGGHGSYRR